MHQTSQRRSQARVVHASVATPLGVAALRDLRADDIEPIVHYWFESGEAFLDQLGIDRARLGTRDDTRRRFRAALPTGAAEQRTLAFAITLDEVLAGYTLLNRYTPEVNHSHWHLIDSGLRAGGISTALYPHRIRLYFERTPMKRLIHQTRTRNAGVNRMLDKYVAVAETRYCADPDGVASPGEFHLRYVHRADVPYLCAGKPLRSAAAAW